MCAQRNIQAEQASRNRRLNKSRLRLGRLRRLWGAAADKTKTPRGTTIVADITRRVPFDAQSHDTCVVGEVFFGPFN